MNEKIQKIYEDYGQLHEEGCELNDEGGSFDGCTCAIKSMIEKIVKQIKNEHADEYANELKQRNRIIAVLLDKLGGQARVFDYEFLNLQEKSDVIAEVSRADNSTLFTLKK